ncbi:MAG: hypothetical protein QOF39_2708 [Frankiales bacterium]|jgi:hypothetical protein|nr:hypothetical protein [Frankiales bacterium]
MATNEELQQQLDAVREEMRQLRAQLRGSAPAGTARVLTRRNLLRAAPVAALGGALTAMAASPAAAATGQPLLLGRDNTAGSDTTTLESPLTLNGRVWAAGISLTGIALNTNGSASVAIQNLAGGTSLDVSGGFAEGQTGDAIHAGASGAVAVAAVATDAPVRFSPDIRPGTAVTASADRGHALVAATSSTTTSEDAVTIDYAGTSRAVYAQSHNPANINGTVTGVNEGHGTGVWGEQRNNTGPGFGVVGVGGSQGRGAQFTGGVAQARLVPGRSSTHPVTGKTGDLYVDSAVRLWFCTRASAGSTAAVWKQIG